MNYTTLVANKATAGSIASWINSDSVMSVAPTLVEEAESAIYRRLRHWQMLKSTTSQNMVIGTDSVPQPADYLEAKILMITGTQAQMIKRKSIEEVKAAYQYDGSGARVNQKPQIYSNNGTVLAFDSPSDQTYPYELTYFAQPAPLATSITNFITAKYQRMMRCALMAGAVEFMKEMGQGQFDRTYWDQLFMTEIGIAQGESDHEQRAIALSGGAYIE